MLVVSVPLLLFWAWPHSRAMGYRIEQVAEKHLLLARNVTAALMRYSSDLDAAFGFVADTLLDDKAIVAPEQLLKSLRVSHVCLVELDSGRILKSFDGLAKGPSGRIAPERLQKILAAGKGRPNGLTGVMLGADGKPGLFQVKVNANRMVLARIDTSYFREVAKTVKFGTKGHAAIVDHRGRLLAHPLPAWEDSARDVSGLSPVVRMISGQAGVTTFYSPALKAEMVAGFAPVPETGWGVMVPQPLAEVSGFVDDIQATSLSIFAMGLLAAALIALRSSLLMVQPLRSVIDGARRMSKGEVGVEIAVPGRLVPSEFRELANTFNLMAIRITESHGREANARERAEQANQQKTDFVRYVTHELRSPVNAILGFVRMAQADRIAANVGGPLERDVHLRHIEEAGTHLLSLVNDLLDLGKVEAGHYTLREEILGLDEIVERCFRLVDHTAKERGISLSVAYERGPPAIRVDERAMYQVILNLVTNAVRYGRPNGLVDLRSYRLEDGGIEICVCDDGPGIAPEDLERAMQPFGRIEREGADQPQGTGLGLPIVKKLVELHGGSFRLESAVGIGTVAYILLPPSRCPARRSVTRAAARPAA